MNWYTMTQCDFMSTAATTHQQLTNTLLKYCTALQDRSHTAILVVCYG